MLAEREREREGERDRQRERKKGCAAVLMDFRAFSG